MADTTTTTNMLLELPIPSVTPGPKYATVLKAALIRIDEHDHTENNGKRITPGALELSSDVDFLNNNLNNVRSVRLQNQTANLNGVADVCAPYTYLGDLWYNNGSGAAVQITAGSTVLATAGTANIWSQTSTNSNLTIQPSDGFSKILLNNSGSINVNLPAANGVGAGRFYVISDNTGSSTAVLVPSGSDQINGAGSTTLSSAFGSWIVTSDGVSKWMLIYTGVSGLTASALTYGTAVLSSVGLTVGANASSDSSAVVRGPNNTVLVSSRNGANNGNLPVLKVDASNNVEVGNTTSGIVEVVSAGFSVGTNPAQSGAVRVPNNSAVSGRNAANSSDVPLIKLTSSNVVQVGDSTSAGISLADYTTTSTGIGLVETGIDLDATSGINFSPARTILVKQGVTEGYLTYDGSNTDPPGFSGNSGGWRPPSGTFVPWLISTAVADELIIPIKRPINGATLTHVRLYYKPRASGVTPSVRLSFDVRLTVLSEPTSNASLMSGGGHSSGSTGEVGSYASTLWTSKLAAMDQFNVIDTSSYSYFVRIKEEQGSGSAPGTAVAGVEFTYTVSSLSSAVF